MDIRALIQTRPPKSEIIRIANYYADHPEELPAFMECYFNPENKMDQICSWIGIYIAETRPSVLIPYHQQMLDYIKGPVHTGVIRNTIRQFENTPIPEEIEGQLLDMCIGYISNPKLPTAIPAFSITVASRICLKYPDLTEEFIELIRSIYEYGGVALQVRVKRAIKLLLK